MCEQLDNSSSSSESCPEEIEPSIIKTVSANERSEVDLPAIKRTMATKRAIPIFDMRNVLRIAPPTFANVTVGTASYENIRSEIAERYKENIHHVHIMEEKGIKEETLLKTFVIITQSNPVEECYNLVVEIYEYLDKTHPELRCVRIPKHVSVDELSRLLLKELNWKGIGICKDDRVLDFEKAVGECGFKNFDRFQVLQNNTRQLKFSHMPRLGIENIYSIEIESSTSVDMAVQRLMYDFRKEILFHKTKDDQAVRLSIRDKVLDGDACIGMALRGGKEDNFRIHLATPNAISITLKYKDFKVKRRDSKYKQKNIMIQHDGSTADLRAEVSRHLHIDPKAVKLTVNGNRIEEYEDLQKQAILDNGCTVVAGIKKRKTLRFKHPCNKSEVAIEIYMLEQVSELKRQIAEKLNIDMLYVTLECKHTELKDSDLLVNYPLKNNMTLTLQLHKNRVLIHVFIRFKKIKVDIVVDDVSHTTVGDLLRFCAHQYQFRRNCSRALFQDRCLNKYLTLAEEGLASGNTVIVANFDHPYPLQGDLIKIFTVGHDGKVENERFGTVCSGILMYAPERIQPCPSNEVDSTPLNNGVVPCGVHVRHEQIGTTMDRTARTKEAYTMTDSSLGTTREDNLVGRDKNNCETKYNKSKETKGNLHCIKAVSLEEDTLESDYYKNNKTKRAMFYLEEGEEDIEKTGTEQKTLEQPVSEQYNRSISVSSISGEYTQAKDINIDNRCIRVLGHSIDMEEKIMEGSLCKSCLKKPTDDNEICCKRGGDMESKTISNPQERKILSFSKELDLSDSLVNPTSIVQNSPCTSPKEHPYTRTSWDSDANAKSFTSLESINESLETESSGRDETVEHQDERAVITYHPQSCPFLRSTVFNCKPQRRRTCTEGDANIGALGISNMTMPYDKLVCCHGEPNALLNTSGISVPLLSYISETISTNWTKLARRLNVSESEINSIESNTRELTEKCYKSLLSWKNRNGTGATKEILLQTLQDIGHKALAEKCGEQKGYHTA